MAGYDPSQARIDGHLESSAAGLYSYNSPYARLSNDQMNPDDEVDLGNRDEYHPAGPSMRPSFSFHGDQESVFSRFSQTSQMDGSGVGSGMTRESKFREMFRTMSTSIKSGAISMSQRRRNRDDSSVDNGDGPQSRMEMDELAQRYGYVPRDCRAREDAHLNRVSRLYLAQAFMSFIATAGSATLFFFAVKHWEWGPSMNKNLLSRSNWVYKAIEVVFAGVYVTFLGQILTRRAFSKTSKAFNIAEMTMRNWVIQPGSLLLHPEGFQYAGVSLLGGLTVLATLSVLSWTPACNALITPQILWSNWKDNKIISTFVRSSYANINFIKSECPSIDTAVNDEEYGASCIIMRANGESYRTLLAYLGEWEHQNYSANPIEQTGRPGAKSIVFGNTTLQSAWVQTDDFPTVAEVDGRLINNVTLAMPHAGLVSMYSHAYNVEENIRQPGSDVDFGEYDVVASVVTPSINVLCATAQESEVKPLLGQKDDKAKESPLDDVFYWGKKHNGRYRPTFETLAPDYQFVTDPRDTIDGADSIYTMGKAGGSSEYTVCQLRSILTTTCVSRFQVTNSSGSITASCGQDVTAQGFRSYKEVYDMQEDSFDAPGWRDLAVQWNIALGLNNGVINASSANVRLLSGTILSKPELQENVPSLAEMLAVFASPLLVDSSAGATYSHEWRHGDANDTFPAPGQPEDIVTSYRFQTYISGWAVEEPMTPGHVYFFIVLATLFVISSICLVHHLCRMGMVTDYTEPQNLFTLAINSPPSQELQGACGRGPNTKDLGVCFRVGYAETANHYYFEDARDAPARSAAKRVSKLREKRSSRILFGAPSEESQTNLLVADGAYSENYKRLSAKSPLL